MNRRSAQQIIADLKALRIAQGKADWWPAYENHVCGAAEIACRIARYIRELDSEEAYISGLLHDCAKFEQNKQQRFHGVIGYEIMISRNEPEIARACLLHTFPFNKLPPYKECRELFFNRVNDYNLTATYIKQHPLTEADLLIQTADSITDYRGFVTIEQRAAEVERFHNTKIDDKTLHCRRQLKEYFDRKTGIDIYSLFSQPPCSFLTPPKSWTQI